MDKSYLVFGKPYGSTTALGEAIPVHCGYLKCGRLFYTYEPQRKYCCLKHKDAESSRKRREREAKMGAGAAPSRVNAAVAEAIERGKEYDAHAMHAQTPEGQDEIFETAVQNALGWVINGANALGPFTLEHIPDLKVKREVIARLAALNSGNGQAEPIHKPTGEDSTMALTALGFITGKNYDEPVADAPAGEYENDHKRRTNTTKPEDL